MSHHAQLSSGLLIPDSLLLCFSGKEKILDARKVWLK
jgi:hypothetical protein